MSPRPGACLLGAALAACTFTTRPDPVTVTSVPPAPQARRPSVHLALQIFECDVGGAFAAPDRFAWRPAEPGALEELRALFEQSGRFARVSCGAPGAESAELRVELEWREERNRRGEVVAGLTLGLFPHLEENLVSLSARVRDASGSILAEHERVERLRTWTSCLIYPQLSLRLGGERVDEVRQDCVRSLVPRIAAQAR